MMADMFRVPVYKVSVTPWDKIKTQILSHLDGSEYSLIGNVTTNYKGPEPNYRSYDAPIYEILTPYITEISD